MTVELSLTPDRRISVRASYADRERIKTVPGARWNAKDSIWSVPLSSASALILQSEFGSRLTADDVLRREIGHMMSYDADALALSKDPLGVHFSPTLTLDERLRQYQRLGVEWLTLRHAAILGDEMGAGKTAQTIQALKASGVLREGPVIVVAPKSVLWTWQREIGIWDPEGELQPVTASGSAAKRRKALAAIADPEDPANVLLINFEALRTHSRITGYGSIKLKRCNECGGGDDLPETRCEVHTREANEIPWSAVVVDEAHRLKDPKAVQTRAVWAIGQQPSVRYRWALTGTPIANSAMDLWSILHFVDPRVWPSKTAYVDRWLDVVPNPFGGMQVLGINPHRVEEFHKVVDPYMLRRPKAMVLPDLPPKVREVRTCTLSPKEQKAYNEMRDELIAELDDGTDLMAFNPMVQVGRLLQLANSTMITDPGTKLPTPTNPSSKLDLLDEVLDDIESQTEGESVVLWFAHRKLLHVAEERFERAGRRFLSFHGEKTAEERAWAEQEFQAGRVPYLLLTIGAGKEGLTLTRASTQIYVQRTWSLIEDLQSQDRLHRPGQEAERVLIIDLIAEGTVEERLSEKLDRKAESLEEIVKDRDALLEVMR